jgi:pimeloyl-ACP methyl ester carboxylesterase
MPEAPVSALDNSTIVRSFKTPLAQRMFLRSVGVLSRIAPALAARVAERLFLTPPRHPVPDREREILERARAGSVRVAGRRIAAWSWGAGPRILLVHGWGGRGGQLGAFVEPLLARGFSVTAFDAPAHGASEGRVATIPGMAEALRGVVDAVGPVRAVVAHSGGGAVSVWAVREALLGGFVELPAAIAFVAPAANFRGYLGRFMDACGLSASARERLDRGLEARVGVPPEALDLKRLAGDLPLAALVVHDREDAEVPWTEGAAIAAAWPGAELVTTHRLGHRRILRDAAVVGRITDFLMEELAEDLAPAREPSVAAVLC